MRPWVVFHILWLWVGVSVGRIFMSGVLLPEGEHESLTATPQMWIQTTPDLCCSQKRRFNCIFSKIDTFNWTIWKLSITMTDCRVQLYFHSCRVEGKLPNSIKSSQYNTQEMRILCINCLPIGAISVVTHTVNHELLGALCPSRQKHHM